MSIIASFVLVVAGCTAGTTTSGDRSEGLEPVPERFSRAWLSAVGPSKRVDELLPFYAKDAVMVDGDSGESFTGTGAIAAFIRSGKYSTVHEASSSAIAYLGTGSNWFAFQELRSSPIKTTIGPKVLETVVFVVAEVKEGLVVRQWQSSRTSMVEPWVTH